MKVTWSVVVDSVSGGLGRHVAERRARGACLARKRGSAGAQTLGRQASQAGWRWAAEVWHGCTTAERSCYEVLGRGRGLTAVMAHRAVVVRPVLGGGCLVQIEGGEGDWREVLE